MKTGLVFEGGAMRGMYTAGVIDVLLENEIVVDGAIGVSAGALFGVNYVSGQKGRVIRYNKRFNGDKDYLGLRPLLKEGNVVSTEYAYGKVPKELDIFDNEAFKASGILFYAVVTNMNSGEPEYIEVKDVFEQMDVLRASGSMPFVSKPVELNGELYLDGGIADSIPVAAFKRMGFEKQIIVLTRDKEYKKLPMSPQMIKAFYHKYPKFAKKLRGRHAVYNKRVERINELEEAGKVLVIRPSMPITIKRIESDPEKLQEVYDMGVADALEKLEELKAYIGKA